MEAVPFVKVLLTGSSGFVGKETSTFLINLGIEVIPFDVMNGYQDIRNRDSIERTIEATKPDRILHLAATARFTDADKYNEKCFDTNDRGSENVALTSRKYNIPVVYSSTGTVYMPITKEMPITEDFPAIGNSNYGCSKRLGEDRIKRWASPWIILRYGHLFGADKKYHGLVGGILAKIRTGQKPVVWGGEQTNDFAYVKDIARANFLALIATPENWNETYNIGTGIEISTSDAAKMVCKAVKYKGPIEIGVKRDVDPARFVYDTRKAEHMLNFKAEYTLETGLEDMLK